MYIVREKSTGSVIHINTAPLRQNLSEPEVYYLFDPETMQIGRTDARELPARFDIDEDGWIVDMERREVGDAAHSRDDTARSRAEIARQIARAYPPSREIQLMKGFFEWIADGQPADDPRETAYREMQSDIARIKERFAVTPA